METDKAYAVTYHAARENINRRQYCKMLNDPMGSGLYEEMRWKLECRV